MTKQELNCKEAYQMAFQCTKSAKLITFNFKFLHRRISTNNFLKKIGIVDSEKCTFCEKETEKLPHLFSTCPRTQVFWTNFKVWLQSCQVIAKETHLKPGHLSMRVVLSMRSERYFPSSPWPNLVSTTHTQMCGGS